MYKVDDFYDELEKLSVLCGEGLLNDWEETFVLSLKNKSVTTPLSAKQVLKLNDILDKCHEKGYFEKGWNIC